MNTTNTRFIFKVEAAEKIQVGSQVESGDTIISQNCKTLTQAKKLGEKLLKNNNVYSVWIHQFELYEQGDPVYQWRKYQNESWTGTSGW
jgi:hypothetical protein